MNSCIGTVNRVPTSDTLVFPPVKVKEGILLLSKHIDDHGFCHFPGKVSLANQFIWYEAASPADEEMVSLVAQQGVS